MKDKPISKQTRSSKPLLANCITWEKNQQLRKCTHHYQIAYQIDIGSYPKGMRHILEKMERWNQAVAMLDIEATLIEKKRPAVYLN